MKRIILQFIGPELVSGWNNKGEARIVEEKFHIPIAACWDGGTGDDLHIQFKLGGDNFFVTESERRIGASKEYHGCFVVKYRGELYYLHRRVFCSTPMTGSKRLSQKELEGFWDSPNRC